VHNSPQGMAISNCNHRRLHREQVRPLDGGKSAEVEMAVAGSAGLDAAHLRKVCCRRPVFHGPHASVLNACEHCHACLRLSCVLPAQLIRLDVAVQYAAALQRLGASQLSDAGLQTVALGPITVRPWPAQSPAQAPPAQRPAELSNIAAWLTIAWLRCNVLVSLVAVLVTSTLLWRTSRAPPRPAAVVDEEPSFSLPSDSVASVDVLDGLVPPPVMEDDGEAVKTGSFAFPAPPCRVLSTDPLILAAAGVRNGETGGSGGWHAGMDADQQQALVRNMARRVDAAEAVAAKAAADPDPQTPTGHPLRWSDDFYRMELRGAQRPGGAPSGLPLPACSECVSARFQARPGKGAMHNFVPVLAHAPTRSLLTYGSSGFWI